MTDTELEQARAHLRDCQATLQRARDAFGNHNLRRFEEDVLAAISWVWDAQERAARPNGGSLLVMTVKEATAFMNGRRVFIGDTIRLRDYAEARIIP